MWKCYGNIVFIGLQKLLRGGGGLGERGPSPLGTFHPLLPSLSNMHVFVSMMCIQLCSASVYTFKSLFSLHCKHIVYIQACCSMMSCCSQMNGLLSVVVLLSYYQWHTGQGTLGMVEKPYTHILFVAKNRYF